MKKGTWPAARSSASWSAISFICSSDSSAEFVRRAEMARASSSRLWAKSQRGVSGTAMRKSRKKTAGTAMTPSIQRHATSSCAISRMMAFEA